MQWPQHAHPEIYLESGWHPGFRNTFSYRNRHFETIRGVDISANLKHGISISFIITFLIFSCSGKEPKHQKEKKFQVANDSTPEQDFGSQTNVNERIKQRNDSIPLFAARTFATLSKQYVLDDKKIILGDFNGDDKEDFSARIINLENRKKGIIIIHNSDKDNYYVFGAGKVVNGMDDLKWIDEFRSIPKGDTVAATLVDEVSGDIIGPDKKHAVVLKSNGIYMHVGESEGGGVIYWNGQKYEWLHIE